MKNPLNFGVLALFSISSAYSATVIPISSFDPTTFFNTAIAGIDFDDGTSSNYPTSPTQPGFFGVGASSAKTYSVTNGGITFDINISNANLANQNRNRNNAAAGAMLTDFEQWYGRNLPGVEASINLSGLAPNTFYEVSMFTMNLGAGNTRHFFYDGTSSADPLIIDFSTSGGPANLATWSPGVTIEFLSDALGEIDVTVQATTFTAGPNIESRLTFNGMSVVQGATIPEPTSLTLSALAVVGLLRRRRR